MSPYEVKQVLFTVAAQILVFNIRRYLARCILVNLTIQMFTTIFFKQQDAALSCAEIHQQMVEIFNAEHHNLSGHQPEQWPVGA